VTIDATAEVSARAIRHPRAGLINCSITRSNTHPTEGRFA